MSQLLRVLLLEDDPSKKHRLLAFLTENKGTLFAQIDTALAVGDAIARMKQGPYDLLIADVVIPAVLGGVASEDHSIELFTQIDEGVGLQRPKYSVAISAEDQLSPTARNFFVGRPWGILTYSDSTDESLVTIRKICEYVLQQNNGRPSLRECDILVVSALMEPEFSEIESATVDWEPLEPLDEAQFVKYGRVSVSGVERIVAAAFAPRAGPVASAILVAKGILRLKPKLVIMCGICAGLPDKAAIGDVVAADVSWDWQSGKYVDKDGLEHFEISPHQIAIDEKTRSQLTMLKRDTKFWASLGVVSATVERQAPKLVIGPIATGASVLADERVSERIKSTQHRNLVGLDMEVYGVYAAATACDQRVRFVALKSVCDHGDEKKDDKYQKYASQIAASTVFYFVKNYAGPLFS